MIKPDIALSDLYLNISVETGSSYRGSFVIYSINNVDLSGFVLSTNDKVEVVNREISGSECEIFFHFKGRMAIPGEEHFGEFLLITNGGEYNIPYLIEVVSKKLWIQETSVGSLPEFGLYAKENWNRAKEVFFTQEFQDIFFQNKDESYELYRGLLKGQSKDAILDQFLIGAAGKKPVMLVPEAEWVRIDYGKKKWIRVELQGWGYAEGKITSRDGNLILDQDSFYKADFENEILVIETGLKPGCLEDELIIETVYEQKRIRIQAAETERKRSYGKREKNPFPVLLRCLVDLRTGKITVEEYLERSFQALPHTGAFYELYDFQLSILSRQHNKNSLVELECDGKAKKIEEKKMRYYSDPSLKAYYYYLFALYRQNPDAIRDAALRISEIYEKNHGFYEYLFLMMVDERVALDTKKQVEQLYAFLKQGVRSPLLYLSLLDVLNKEPYYLEGLTGFRTSVIAWALRHGYLSLELSRQYAAMTLKEKHFRKKYLNPLVWLYDIRKEDAYLKTICSLLIKGSRTENRYHRYFKEAVEKDLKIVGLNEFFLRTLDFQTYPILPKPVLLYFHYSSSLNHTEKAYLYTNILRNQKEYEYILDNYLIRIEQFVKEQLKAGKISFHLAPLYEVFLPKLCKDPELAKCLPNIIFKKNLVCHHRFMEGVYVCHYDEEVYVPLMAGACQVEIYSEQAVLFFADAKGNRYRHNISYELKPYLDEEQFRDVCLRYQTENKKVISRWLDPYMSGRISDLFYDNSEIRSWRREKTVERILDAHYEKKAMEELSECLDQINYRIINPSYRRTLMNYYMACDRMEDAYFGVELYGSDLMDTAQLYLLTCVGLYLHKEERDELLLVMAHRCFLFGRYNREILVYLRNHFEGRNFDLLALWTVLKKEKLDTAEFEEKLLNQMLFTGERDVQILKVLLSYLEKEENDELAIPLLEIYSTYYFVGRRAVPESFFEILEKQIEKENLPLMIRLSYLLRKSQYGFLPEEESRIGRMTGELLSGQIFFGFFDAFDHIVDIPSLYKEMTVFYGYETEKMEMNLFLELTGQDGKVRTKYLPMREILPGFYYTMELLLSGETTSKISLFHGDEEIGARIHSSKMELPVKNSRREILGKMEKNPKEAEAIMRQYEMALERMDKQLRMLGE